MRGILLSTFGAPSVLVPTTLPEPVAAAGQALIDVEIANITFIDTQLRAGKPPNPAMLPRLPMVPGNGVGGVVSALGPGVEPTLLGTRVVASTGGSGGYAERVAVDASAMLRVPDDLQLATAVAVLADGRTALALMDAARVVAGETVLVEAAAGGVGSLLVQLAHAVGARVIGAAGGARKLALASELGADLVVDYTDPRWPEQVHAHGGVDVVFDGVGGDVGRAAFGVVRAGGRFCSYGLASGSFTQLSADEAAQRQISVLRGMQLSPQALLELTRSALAEAAAGRMRPVIGQTFPLEQAAEAHAAMEARATLGKTLLVTRAAPARDRS